jgi:Zn-dependent protease
LLIKLGPKIFSVLVKLAKTAKVGKVALFGASMASYAYLWSWQFAAMIMLLLLIHESGHLWAMKQRGMKTKGIYFIPFIGGAAVAEEDFPTRGAEAYIAIMGPLWGFVLAAATAGVYYYTLNPLFAAAASWMAMVNLFNLLPIDPLDGGRIIKAAAFSLHSKLGVAFLILGLGAGVVLAVYVKAFLFVLLLVLGAIDLMVESRNAERLPKMSGSWTLASLAVYSLTVVVFWLMMSSMQHVPGADIAMKVFM